MMLVMLPCLPTCARGQGVQGGAADLGVGRSAQSAFTHGLCVRGTMGGMD